MIIFNYIKNILLSVFVTFCFYVILNIINLNTFCIDGKYLYFLCGMVYYDIYNFLK